jgi:uncharacterized protein
MKKPSSGAAKKPAKASAKPVKTARVRPSLKIKPGPARKAAAPVKPGAKAAAAKPQPRLPAKLIATKTVAKPVPAAAKPTPTKPVSPAPAAVKPTVSNGAAKNGTNGSHPKPVAKPVTKPIVPLLSKPTPRPEPVIPPEKDLSTKGKTGPVKDRIVLMVPDPFWLHAVWEVSMQSVLRAEAALGQDWHGAKPILRLFDVTSQDTTSTSEAPLRDMPIHGGCSHWYIDVPQPPRSYRADIGYLSRRGQFYVLARSNVVTPPRAGASETVDENWAADIDKVGGADRVLAMSTGFETTSGPSQLKEFFDEQFKKPAKEGSFGAGAAPGKLKKFHFDIDAELIVFGRADPAATVTLQNERVPLRPDGTFTMRFSLPDSRQIIPAVAASSDGLEEQTIVLAVERNIKRLDPTTHDMYGES